MSSLSDLLPIIILVLIVAFVCVIAYFNTRTYPDGQVLDRLIYEIGRQKCAEPTVPQTTVVPTTTVPSIEIKVQDAPKVIDTYPHARERDWTWEDVLYRSGSRDVLASYLGPDSVKRDFDYRAVFDKLVPPRQRGLYDDYPLNPMLYPVYTSGFPTKFIKIGTLVCNDVDESSRYKFLHLIASRLNSGQFSYYATPTSENDTQKFQIETNRELSEGDNILVKMLDKNYRVVIDRNAYSLFYGN